MPKCVVCGGTEFYIEAGFYFCQECQTQNEDLREEVVEYRIDPNTRLKRSRIRQDKSSTSEQQTLGWTTWEQYNFILIGLTNELVELGASSNITMTILQLWAFYLKNVEVAFTSTSTRSVPRLARRFHKRDAEIIYGKIAQRKRNRRKSTGSGTSASSVITGTSNEGSSNREINRQKKRMYEAEYEKFVQSQDSSEGDVLSVMNQSLFSVQSSGGRSSVQTEDNIRFNKAAKSESAKVKVLSMKLPRTQRVKYRKTHVTTQYKIGPQVLTPMKLWALIYLALRIHDERIHLADMLRYGREGHLSYYKLDHLLPPEVTLTRSETNLLHQTKEITHKGMRRAVASLAKFLEVWETREPDFAMLLERYCIELQLPKGVMVYAERMMSMSPPRMHFDAKSASFPNYEGRAMAFIVVVMKILFGLDGITEYEIGRVIEKINGAASTRDGFDARLFNFAEWQRYIECRRCALANVHFPTRLRLEPDAPGNHHLYLKFMAGIKSKSSDREEPEVTNYKHLMPRELADSMRMSVERLNDIAVSESRDVEIFPASLTPQHSYLQQLLEDPEKDVPTNMRMDFHSTKIGYMTDPESLQALASQRDIDLNIADTGLHFIEKIVAPFEQSNLPTIEEFKKPVRVQRPAATKSLEDWASDSAAREDAIEYLHRKNPGRIFVDSSKRADYDGARKSSRRRRRDFLGEYTDDFGFDDVLPSGKLAIHDDSDSDSGSVRSISVDNGGESLTNENVSVEDVDSLAKYNLSLSRHEKRSLLDPGTANLAMSPPRKPRRNIPRDSVTGQFVSPDPMTRLEKTRNISSRTRDRRREIAKSALLASPASREDRAPEVTENHEDRAPEVTEDQEGEVPEVVDVESSYDFGLRDDDISILHESSVDSSRRETSGRRFVDSTTSNDHETLFRPYADYWTYRCNFSRVKQRNFRQLERNLPASFRWLLGECANVVEMSNEDLYEEVCLVESYYADILGPRDCPANGNQYEAQECRTKAHYNLLKKKW